MYGEVRGLEPSGGRPQLTFYFPPLRHPLSYTGAAQIVMSMSPAEYLERVCGCAVCSELVGGDIRNLGAYFQTYRPDGAKRDFPTQEALDLDRFHYLLARGAELEFVRARPEGQLIADLLAAADPYPPSASSALRRWAERLGAALGSGVRSDVVPDRSGLMSTTAERLRGESIWNEDRAPVSMREIAAGQASMFT